MDWNYGVFFCGFILVISFCEVDEEEGGEEGIVEKFRLFVFGLVKILKGFFIFGYVLEYDVMGIMDFFV